MTTSVTNLDIHDISRSCRTFGIRKYFLVTPLEPQHRVVERILRHWKSDLSKEIHPDRASALQRAELAKDFDEVLLQVKEDLKRTGEYREGEEPEVILTDASVKIETADRIMSYAELRSEIEGSSKDGKISPRKRPMILVFGTGWGVDPIFYPKVHRILAPVYGRKNDSEGDYNHLSVRAAAAIILDRLFGH